MRNTPAARVDSRVRPPDFTLIIDWPIMAQPAMPPRNPVATLAMPWPRDSRSLSERVSVMSSMSWAVSSDSSSPTKARVKAYGAMIERVSRPKGTSGSRQERERVGQGAHVADGGDVDAEQRAADAEHDDGDERRGDGGGEAGEADDDGDAEGDHGVDGDALADEVVELGEEDQDRQGVDEADHHRAGDEAHQPADAEGAEGDLDDAGEDRGGEQVLDAVVLDQRDDDQRHGAGGGGDHGGPAAGEGDDDGDDERGVEPDLGVDAGDDRERDRLGDQGQGDDEPGEQVGARVGEPGVAGAAPGRAWRAGERGCVHVVLSVCRDGARRGFDRSAVASGPRPRADAPGRWTGLTGLPQRIGLAVGCRTRGFAVASDDGLLRTSVQTATERRGRLRASLYLAASGPTIGRQQHVGGGQGAELVAVGGRGAEAAMTMENSPRAMSAVPARSRPARPTPGALRRRTGPRSAWCRRSRRPGPAAGTDGAEQRRRDDLEREEQEERGGEQVAERLDELDGTVAHGTRQGQADQERADGARHLQLLGQPADQQREPEHGQQQRLVRPRGEHGAEPVAPAQRERPGSPRRRPGRPPTVRAVASGARPATRAATTGRYTAMARSSMTSRFRIAGVSRLPSRSRSVSTLETTPDELTQLTPPSRTASVGVPPEQQPEPEARE